MNKMTAIIIAIVVAVVVILAATMLMDNGKKGEIEENEPQLYVTKNMSDNIVDVYLGEKGSSDMILVNEGGTFKIPKNPVITVVAKNPVADLSVDGKRIVVPMSSDTYYVTVAFDKGKWDAPVLIGSDSAYVAFMPDKSVKTINLGLFMTNDPDSGSLPNARLEVYNNDDKETFNVYLGQKGSSQLENIDVGGYYDIPKDDPILVIKVNEIWNEIYVDDDCICIPLGDNPFRIRVIMYNGVTQNPVKIDSHTAYVAFEPTDYTVYGAVEIR